MDLGAKLQLKPGQSVEGVLVPAAVAAVLPAFTVDGDQPLEAALVVFVADRSTLENCRTQIVEAAARDRLTWVAYPKSGQLGTDLHRDSVVALLTGSGVQPVRQIAIDSVWSALRFRPA